MKSWAFTIPLPASPYTPNQSKGQHWRSLAARTKLIRQTVQLAAKSEANRLKPSPPTGPRDLTIVWHRTTGRLLDDDALAPSMKACRDGIADAGWLYGNQDSATAVRNYVVKQDARKAQHESITVTVSEVPIQGPQP